MDIKLETRPSNLQHLTARTLIPKQKDIENLLADSNVLLEVKKYWYADQRAAYLADAVYYPRRYRDLKNGAISI